jgi:3-phosphoshikimate 1-carboxyvinyltransferase
MLPASDIFEDMIRRFGGQLTVAVPKIEIIQNPDDPRKKKRIKSDDFHRRLMLSPSARLTPTEIIVPSDADIVNGLLTLAVLRRKKIIITNVNLNSDMMCFLNYLKSLGAELNIGDRKTENGYSLGSVTINRRDVKARRFSGGRASSLIDNIPFMAVLAALGTGTTIIRDIAEFHEWGVEPTREIADNLARIGVKCGVLNDGLAIEGSGEISGGDFGPFNNIRIALAFYMAALAGEGGSGFEGYELIENHYPEIISIFGEKVVLSPDTKAVQ